MVGEQCEVTEGGKRYRQLEREGVAAARASLLRLQVSGCLSAGTKQRGQQGTRNGTAQPRVTFIGLCDNPIFSRASTVSPAIVARKQSHYFSWANLGNMLCHRDERSDYACSAIRLCSTVVEVLTGTRFTKFYGTTW